MANGLLDILLDVKTTVCGGGGGNGNHGSPYQKGLSLSKFSSPKVVDRPTWIATNT